MLQKGTDIASDIFKGNVSILKLVKPLAVKSQLAACHCFPAEVGKSPDYGTARVTAYHFCRAIFIEGLFMFRIALNGELVSRTVHLKKTCPNVARSLWLLPRS